jgi:esterase/lipase/1-acyl-sn-glycerol-3-phosphate acyltransferase
MIQSDLLINTNGYVLSLLEKILDANIEVKGIENIPKDNPKMFIANHFTRTEAMLVPYTLYNITGKKVGIIADESLFKSYIGDFLTNLGAIKTSDQTKYEHIIGDLITSCKNWMIFPEGRMVKAKDIKKIDDVFCVNIDNSCQRVYTGASVFALSSEFFREKYFDNKIEDYDSFSSNYFINNCSDINKNETMIVPINISYTKIRNGKNFLLDMVERVVDNIQDNFKEELEIESNLVLNSKIIIRILKPVSTKDIIKELYDKDFTKEQILNELRYKVTQNLMNYIYESLTINFDHIFTLILFLNPTNIINIDYFKRLIYLVFYEIKKNSLFYDEDINKDLIYLISYEKFKLFDDILEVAIKDEILTIDENNFLINKEKLADAHTHHTIRLKNILKVILNEILINEKVINIVKALFEKNEIENNESLVQILKDEENKEYEESYEKYINNENIRSQDIGKTKYFESINSNSCVIAIHGFSSAPKEVEKLAIFLNKNNLNVIAPRLSGHGTVPEDLKNKKWEDWYKSISRAITIASIQCKRVYIVGFSTGGLLALLSTKKQYKEFVGLVCINAALHLNDLRIKTLLPAISFWNDVVKVFSDDKYTKEYVDNFPENPEINYNKHYVDSIEQLNLLMKKTRKSLYKIRKPILIIQGQDDPIVNPSSAHEIYEKIESRYKSLKIIEASRHVIITGDNTDELFDYILDFTKQGEG